MSNEPDVNPKQTGLNCLYQACLLWNLELVEQLIDAGANVNWISTETNESLLDCVVFEQRHEQQRGSAGAEQLGLIIDTLIRHGGKYTAELGILH